MLKQKLSIVWFKRDLRLTDHQPLKTAIESGDQLLLLYCFDPELIADPHYDLRHWRFVWESINDINDQLISLGHQIQLFHCSPKKLLTVLSEYYQIKQLYSHQESGLKITYDLDKWVVKHCADKGITWNEFMYNGIVRGAQNRQNWLNHWHGHMKSNQAHPDLNKLRTIALDPQLRTRFNKPVPKAFQLVNRSFQKGGRTMALKYLSSFLTERVSNYSFHISKPEESRRSCSRLSPYLAWGNLSLKEVYQARLAAKDEYGFKRPSANFGSRLQWHDHFVQKFEMEERYQFEHINRGFDYLQKTSNPAFVAAWKQGKTGVPMVDACTRQGISTLECVPCSLVFLLTIYGKIGERVPHI